MQLYDAEGRRLYFTEDERRAFVIAAAKASREVRTFCGVLHATGCRISEALALTAQQIDLSGRVVVFESLKKRRKGVYPFRGPPPQGHQQQKRTYNVLRKADIFTCYRHKNVGL